MELRRGLLGALVCASLAGCGETPPGRTYYERKIEPILLQKCAGNTSGCHSTNTDDPFAIAAGNLDVTSFENVQRRRDALTRFGPYPHSLFLIKAVGPGALKMQYFDQFVPIDVQHSGGGIFDVGSDAFFDLQTWLENGATRDGILPATPAQAGEGNCTPTVPAGFDPAPFLAMSGAEASFTTYKQTVQPIFDRKGCAAGSCHGAPQSDFFITCGTDDTQLAFNFIQTWAFVSDTVDDSQLLRTPLAVGAGGRGHTGGDQFSSATEDDDYTLIRTWAAAAGKQPFATGDPEMQFFADNVQKALVQRGCAFQACHSPQAGNDFKMRSGTVGFFSRVALEKNYHLLKDEFMAMEFADSRRSRAVAKALLEDDPRITGVAGILHRGGPVLETPRDPITNTDFLAEPAACPPTYDPATATPFCTIQRWVELERAAAPADYTPMGPGSPINIVYVQRPSGGASAGRLEFDTFQGGAELMVAGTTLGMNQQLAAADAGAATAIHAGCGLGATADIQAPDVAHDGTRVVFAARASANEPLGVFAVNIDGSGCNRLTPAAPDANGLKVHNFDPAWSPDGTHVVFASTRGKGSNGPTRSRKRLLPQSDLWRIPVTGTAASGSPEQMTFLSNSEIGPQFMREGRVTMTTEKVSDGVLVPGQTVTGGFYQLAGRRINWDLTDYHPLLAQRKDSVYANVTRDASGAFPNLMATMPSVGYSSATDIREGSNGDFLMIVSDNQANGAPVLPGAAGALAIFNRSVGPFEQGRVQEGYLPSMKILDGTMASGRAGAVSGYRHPVSLPDGTIMVSYASNVTAGNFEIVAIDPRTGARRDLFTNGAGIRVDAVLAYKYPARKLYENRRQLVFGGATGLDGDPDHAVLYIPDAPMLFTVLTGNLRRGRPVDAFRSARFLAVLAEGMCPSGGCTAGPGGFFESRTMLGRSELRDDGSTKIRLPSGTGVVLQLQDASGNPIVTMGEEHQLGPDERISMGIREDLFDAVCAGCHGSISGRELDVQVTPDALTGASRSDSFSAQPTVIGN